MTLGDRAGGIGYTSQLAYAKHWKRKGSADTLNPLVIVFLVLLVLSGVGLIIFILMHSGKGTGISDMAAQLHVILPQTGTSIIEKNLDRITIGCAIVFLLSLVVLMSIYPHGTVTQ